MKISHIITASPALLTPRDLTFSPLRPGTGAPKLIPRGTRVNYTIERVGDFNDERVLRLYLPKKIMGYKTYTWSATFDSTADMIADGFAISKVDR